MSTLRDLLVSIDFDDVDIKKLIEVDSVMDEIEDQLRGIGGEIDDVSKDLTEMGVVGSTALNDIQDEAEDAITKMLFLEKAIHEVVEEERKAIMHTAILGNTMAATGIKGVAMGVGIAAAIGLIAAVGAPILLLLGGLAASLLAAGGAAAAFGAVAIPTFTSLFETASEIEKIEEKIANADTYKERIAAQKELAAAMDGLSDSEKGALGALQSFKSFFSKFSAQFEEPLFDIFATGLEATTKLLTQLTPTINSTMGVIDQLMDSFNVSLGTSEAGEFFKWLETNGARAISNFAQIGGNLLKGFFNMLSAFSPIGATIEEGLIGMTERFNEWAKGLESSQGFQNFVNYAMQNGPVLLDVIGNIWDIFKNLITDLAPFGSTVLEGIRNFTDLILNNWGTIKETVIGLGIAVGTFAIAMKGLQVVAVITSLIKAWRAGTLAATAAQLGLNTAMWANPITWVIAGIAALIAIGVLLYRNWDTVKEKAVALWGVIQENPILDFLTKPIQWVIKGIVSLWQNFDVIKAKAAELWQKLLDNPMLALVAGPIGALIAAGIRIYQNWDTIKEHASLLWDAIKTIFGKIKDWIVGKMQPIVDLFHNIKDVWNDFVGALKNFKMPAWLDKFTNSLGGGLGGKVKDMIMGSHATGLERVPHDGYVAELHRNEAVLTSSQSDALREAGILSSDGSGRPKLSLGEGGQLGGSGGGRNVTYAPQYQINVEGGGEDSAEKFRRIVQEENEKFWRILNLQQV